MKKVSIGTILILLLTIWGCGGDLPEPGDDKKSNGEGVVIEPFENIPGLDEMVVYEVNLRSYSNAGTINGLKTELDHIQSLGVNVVWIMPLYPIGQERGINSPYSISDYEDVNPEFGSLDDLKRLVNEAHSRDMAVILDWVANHTAWDHPWISEHPEWYSQDEDGNIISPPGTGWEDVADLDFDNQDMRNEMIEAMSFWVKEAGIDGFRCDAVDFVPQDFWSEAIDGVDEVTEKDLIWLGEGGESWNFTAGFEFNYSWDFYGRIKNVYSEGLLASSLFAVHNQEYSVVPSGKSKLRYITNHDVYAWDETPHEVYDEGQVGAFVATAFMPGIPLIYSGQEVANPELISFFDQNPIDWSQNPEILEQYQEVMNVWTNSPAVHSGTVQSYATSDIIAFTRIHEEEEVLILVNVRSDQMAISVEPGISGSWENAFDGEVIMLEDQITLSGYEYLILKR